MQAENPLGARRNLRGRFNDVISEREGREKEHNGVGESAWMLRSFVLTESLSWGAYRVQFHKDNNEAGLWPCPTPLCPVLPVNRKGAKKKQTTVRQYVCSV